MARWNKSGDRVVESMKYRISLVSIIFLVLLNNLIYATSIDRVYNPLFDTMEEASSKSKTGNPLDLFVDYKNYMDSVGETIDSNQFINWWASEDEIQTQYESIRKNTPQIIEELETESASIDKNLRHEVIPSNDNFEYRTVATKTYSIKKIVAIVVLLVILIILYIFKRKKVFIIIGLVVVAYGILRIGTVKQIEDKCNHIEEYLLGISDKHISHNVNIDVNKTKDEISDKLDLKWDISQLINDYILKICSCNYSINKGMLIPEKYKTNDGKEDFTFLFYNDENVSSGFGYPSDYLFNDNISIFRCKSKEEILFEELFEKIEKQTTSYNDLLKIYDNVKNNESDKFIECLDSINSKVTYNEPNKKEEVFNYLERIMNLTYIYDSSGYTDCSAISYFKDWYIDGESRDIELPYGVTLEYRAPEFVKKDIKEIVYTNERELDHDSKEKQVYVMYYKDSEGKLGASYTDIEFTKTGNNYEISFNPVDLMYDIKKPTARLVVK